MSKTTHLYNKSVKQSYCTVLYSLSAQIPTTSSVHAVFQILVLRQNVQFAQKSCV